jgi:hypothetical protein
LRSDIMGLVAVAVDRVARMRCSAAARGTRREMGEAGRNEKSQRGQGAGPASRGERAPVV